MTLIQKAVEFDKLSAAMRKQYKDEQALYAAGWWLQPKYDGVFGMAIMRAEREDCRIVTRTGEPIRSCEHILDALHALGPGAIDRVFLGELYSNQIPFPEISGLVRRHAASPILEFRVFDYLPIGLETGIPYCERYMQLSKVMPTWSEVVQLVHLILLPSQGSVKVVAEKLKLQGGFDGAILRDPKSPYTIGLARKGEIVKVKPVLNLDLVCNGVIQGEGKHFGKLGAITVSYRGVSSAVGTGFSDQERDDFWFAATNPRSGAAAFGLNPVGKIVEIECLGITEDGKLREPRFKGIRFDKTQGDS